MVIIAIVPLYTGETAPKSLRGTLLVVYQLEIIVGLFLSYILDLATHKIPNSASWRVPVGELQKYTLLGRMKSNDMFR